MSITVRNNTFHLKSENVSYIFGMENGKLVHYYWGNALNSDDIAYCHGGRSWGYWTHYEYVLPHEFPLYGAGDFKTPMVELEFENGSRVVDFKYVSHYIYNGKNKLDGLPATYVENADEAQTLEVTLYDDVESIEAVLCYTIFIGGAICRNVRITNQSKQEVKINRILSANIDFLDSDYEVISLHGAWARERHIQREKLSKGTFSISSTRGASSHFANPFLALVRSNTTENSGDAYGINLVYSGNFEANTQIDAYNTLRLQIGINSFDFSWILEQDETFQSPEVVLVYSNDGLNGMSQIYHKLFRERLCRGKFRDESRPILINNWEATYFDFNDEKLIDIAMAGKEMGLELFVLDDGWFGVRNDDKTSLGDWIPNKEKLPIGLDGLANKINSIGMKFGLWFEPEMISPQSELYEKHPDWCLHIVDRNRTEGRFQLILDLSREDVCDYIIDFMSNILSSANISYVKWDMNRNMTEICSAIQLPKRQKETAHRYMLGLYHVLETITSRFPDVLFESCSGGGGRFDGGMLYYMPQVWTSDNTDAYERLFIQYGTSIVYPISTMGAHISAVPNHQTGRTASLKMRGDVALSGNFGYELDLSKATIEEKETMKEQVVFYKKNRDLIQFGDFYRLESPFEGNFAAWQFVSNDKMESIVCIFKKMAVPSDAPKLIKLQGLDDNLEYEFENDGFSATGLVLKNVGVLFVASNQDLESLVIKLIAKKS